MKYFYDTEFIEDGNTIELVSIGIIAEDGRQYYAISNEFDVDKANSWVKKNVLPKLMTAEVKVKKSKYRIRNDILNFFHQVKNQVELYSWVACYDHVVLCQLWGEMANLPDTIPRYTNDLKQLWKLVGSPALPPRLPYTHNALSDARFNYNCWLTIKNHVRNFLPNLVLQ